jgi:thiol-disulfide isomerase/thioredoxin
MMKITAYTFFAVFLLVGLNLNSQDTINVQFDKKYHATAGNGFMKLIDYKDSNLVYYNGVAHQITFPDNFFVSDTALAFNYFTGWTNARIENTATFLIGNYKSFKPVIYVDYNYNLDFSDDGQPIRFNSDSTAEVFLKNSEITDAYFPVKLSYDKLKPEMKKQIESFFANSGPEVYGNEIVSVNYWLADSRMNYKVSNSWLKGTNFTIVLEDYNCNGLFNDKGKDRIIISHDENFCISQRLDNEIALIISDTMQVEIGNEIFEIFEIDPAGDFITLINSQKEYVKPLTIGSDISHFKVNLTKDSSRTIAELQDSDKLFLLYSWGSWCKGCTQQLPSLKEFYEINESRLQIIGLNHGDSKAKMEAYLKENQITWLNGYFTEKNSKALRIDSYPNYILLDHNGKIIVMNGTIDEIKRKL